MNNLGNGFAIGVPCSNSHNFIGFRKGFYATLVTLLAVVIATAVAMATAQSADAGILGSISAAKQKEKGLASEVSQMNGQIAAIRKDVIRIQGQESAAQAKLGRIQVQLAVEEKRLEKAKRELDVAFGLLEDRIVEMYKSGKIDILEVLVKSKNYDDFLHKKEFLDRLAEADAKLVKDVQALKRKVEASKAHYKLLESQVTAARNQLREARAAREAESAGLVVARSTRQSALKSVRGKISSLEAKQLVQAAAVAQPAPLGGAPSAPGSGYGAGGPNFGNIVNGIVGDRPGACRDGCSRRHAGTDISAPTGTPVKAPRDCTINFAGTMQGYGLTVRGSCGLFAHLSRIAVSSGQKVSAGTVVGYVGSTGFSTGPHLHYEEGDRFG